jgi:hypothetical protein
MTVTFCKYIKNLFLNKTNFQNISLDGLKINFEINNIFSNGDIEINFKHYMQDRIIICKNKKVKINELIYYSDCHVDLALFIIKGGILHIIKDTPEFIIGNITVQQNDVYYDIVKLLNLLNKTKINTRNNIQQNDEEIMDNYVENTHKLSVEIPQQTHNELNKHMSLDNYLVIIENIDNNNYLEDSESSGTIEKITIIDNQFGESKSSNYSL